MNISKVIAYNRVERTAKLMGVSGSVAARNNLASFSTKRAYLMLLDSLNNRTQKGKQPYLTLLEVIKPIKKLAQGVAVSLDCSTDKSRCAAVLHEQVQGEIKAIYAHTIELPFVKNGKSNIIKEPNFYVLPHEIRHFFDGIMQPKLLARENSIQRVDSKYKHWNLYSDKIYFNHGGETDKIKVVSETKNLIEQHFDKHKTKLKDRIEILQYWRYQLKTELTASKEEILCGAHSEYSLFKGIIGKGKDVRLLIEKPGFVFDSTNFATKTEKQKALKEFKKLEVDYNYKEKYGDNFFFEEKINVLDEMLAQTIAKVRARQKNVLELKNKR